MPGFEDVRDASVRGTAELTRRIEALAPEDWNRRTRCPGWTVRDVAWHVSWGEGPGRVIRAARTGEGPPPYATELMGPAPEPDEILRAIRGKPALVARDLGALTPKDADLVVRYGRGDPGRRLEDFLWASLLEVVVHTDDLLTALGVDQPADPAIAGELVRRRVRGAVGWASEDGLQPVAPRGYRLTGDGVDCGFYHRDGTWHEGLDDDVPTCAFTADPTTLLRLVMGRIPVSPFEAVPGRPWDDRLKLTGELRVALPFDFMRWCYGAW